MHSVEDHLRWREALFTSLSHFAPEEASDLVIHLGDLHDGFLRAAELIEQLANITEDYDPEILRRNLSHLKGAILSHLPSHIREVEPTLSAVVSRLYQEADEKGEFDD